MDRDSVRNQGDFGHVFDEASQRSDSPAPCLFLEALTDTTTSPARAIRIAIGHHGCSIQNARRRVELFFDKVIALDPEEGECWIWQASRGGHGYGYGQFGFGNGFMGPAHRWSYEHFVGPILEGLVVDHLCRRPECVNPDHLEAVTQRENLRRGRRDRIIYGSVWGERGEHFDAAREMRLNQEAADRRLARRAPQATT